MEAPRLEDLTLAQAKALRRFADQNGKRWKSKLSILWLKSEESGPLRQIGNALGPLWLFNFHDIEGCHPRNEHKFRQNLPGDEEVSW